MKHLDLCDSYSFLFEVCSDAVYAYEMDESNAPSHFIEVNESACTMLGYSREELQGMSVFNLSPAGALEEEIHQFAQLLNTKHDVHTEWTHVSKSGEHIPVELFVRLMSYGVDSSGRFEHFYFSMGTGPGRRVD